MPTPRTAVSRTSSATGSGAAYRQRNLDAAGWQSLSATDNEFGVDGFPSEFVNGDAPCRLPDTCPRRRRPVPR